MNDRRDWAGKSWGAALAFSWIPLLPSPLRGLPQRPVRGLPLAPQSSGRGEGGDANLKGPRGSRLTHRSSQVEPTGHFHPFLHHQSGLTGIWLQALVTK